MKNIELNLPTSEDVIQNLIVYHGFTHDQAHAVAHEIYRPLRDQIVELEKRMR